MKVVPYQDERIFSALSRVAPLAQHIAVRLCLKSPRVYVKPSFSSNEMKCGNRRVGENHSTSCGAAVRAKPKASLRALGSHPPLIGAAEQRLVLCCSNISLAANKTQSPLRG